MPIIVHPIIGQCLIGASLVKKSSSSIFRYEKYLEEQQHKPESRVTAV